MFDLSNYPKDSKFFYPVNEKIIIKIKDVHKRKPIRKFVAIKTKMYCILSDNGKELNTTKGVNITMEFDEYKEKGIQINKIQNKKDSK